MMQLVPQPPEGYRAPYRFQYPMRQLYIASLVVLVASIIGFGLIVARAGSLNGFGFGLLSVVSAIAAAIVAMFATLVVHEAIHGLVYVLFGYRVRFGIAPEMGAAYAIAPHQWQTRLHNLVTALAPLVVMTLALTPLLTIQNAPALVWFAYIALLINTSGAVGDLYISYRLLRMPPGTLLYDISPEQSYVFEPEPKVL